VNEYLHDRTSSLFPGGEKTLAMSCLTYLLLEDLNKEIVLSLSKVGEIRDRFPFLGYANKNWGDHAREALDEDVKVLSVTFLSAPTAVLMWGYVAGDMDAADRTSLK
jgi:hypothetical protein